jgi:hypothetical protein
VSNDERLRQREAADTVEADTNEAEDTGPSKGRRKPTAKALGKRKAVEMEDPGKEEETLRVRLRRLELDLACERDAMDLQARKVENLEKKIKEIKKELF